MSILRQHEEAEAFKRDFAAIWQRNANIVIQSRGAREDAHR
jgi:hypothetical protein